MAGEVIEEKLESLRRCVERVRSRCPTEPSELAANPDLQDIVTLNLTRGVQISVDIASSLLAASELPPPDTMGAAFDGLAELGALDEELVSRLRAAVGFRNIAVHSYRAIDWQIVHRLCTERLDDFRCFAAAVETFRSR